MASTRRAIAAGAILACRVMVCAALLTGGGCATHRAVELPRVLVQHDDTPIERSCRVVIPEGMIIPDANGDGVLHIAADGITVEFEGELRGANTPNVEPKGTAWDKLTGVGIALDGHSGVTLRGPRVAGYKVGVLARHADNLRIEGGEFVDGFRQRLGSTPQREDSADWLWPHENDQHQWREKYGAAMCVEKSRGVTVERVRVRRGQNGIMLDRCDGARLYDNDCSFLSGWGLAMWRSSDCVISRNAFDFCVRGHSEGVYNRGQDSAGVLCFEQCSRNLFAENSVTHGGDGFFGFAGKEALERSDLPGCDANQFIANDFSYAVAHGLELTFSTDNVVRANRFVEDAICGIWGGYSRQCRIEGNLFEGCGGMAYALERGAINMEHASRNEIVRNQFINNACGVHLWWDDDGDLLKKPGVEVRGHVVRDNLVQGNRFVLRDDTRFRHAGRPTPRLVAMQMRCDEARKVMMGPATYVGNSVDATLDGATELDTPSWLTLGHDARAITQPAPLPGLSVLGTLRPVGGREGLAGRAQIIVDEWGPWDHESPMVRLAETGGGRDVYEVYGVGHGIKAKDLIAGEDVELPQPTGDGPVRFEVPAATGGIREYRYELSAGKWRQEIHGTLVGADWTIRFAPWDDTCDPRKEIAAWRARMNADDAMIAHAGSLDLRFAHAGPNSLKDLRVEHAAEIGADHFGTTARAKVSLPAGTWRFATLSDDGVRALVDGVVVIENWTWHGPTRDSGTVELSHQREVEIVVEHFEIDGYATLSLEIEPAR